jgi:plasmid stability protein
MAEKGASVQTLGMADIRVRNLPEAVRKQLRRAALERDMSLNALVCEILTAAAKATGK